MAPEVKTAAATAGATTLVAAASSASSGTQSTVPKRGWHPCPDCKKTLRTKDFNPDSKGRIRPGWLCKACGLPDCYCCGKNRSAAHLKKDRTPLTLDEKTTLEDGSIRWYCPDRKCQSAKKGVSEKVECTVCKGMKSPTDFPKKGNRHLVSICSKCAFPTCALCGTEYKKEHKEVLKSNSPARLGNTWYCSKPACRKALKDARRI